MGRVTHARTRQRGFTLLEVLVVLLIMGVLVGMVSAIVRPDDRAQVRVEAERLAQLLDLAAMESRLTGHPIAWTAESTSYRFWRMAGDGEWSEMSDNNQFRARTLPAGMTISALQVEGMPAQAGMRLEFVPYASTVAFNIEMSMGVAHDAVAGSPIGDIRVVPGGGTPSEGLAKR